MNSASVLQSKLFNIISSSFGLFPAVYENVFIPTSGNHSLNILYSANIAEKALYYYTT